MLVSEDYIYNDCRACGTHIGIEPHVHRRLRAKGEAPVQSSGWWGFWHERCYQEQRRAIGLRIVMDGLNSIRRIFGKGDNHAD